MLPDDSHNQPPPDDDATRPGPPAEPTPPVPEDSDDTGTSGPDSSDPLSGIFGLDPAVQAGPDPLIGTVVGDARILRLIGQGGMGRVYEGYQEQLGRTVAVKVMRPGLVATPEMQKRFDREAKILARLRHPGIAQVYAAGTEVIVGAVFSYFVMEFIPNARTLTQYAEELTLSSRARLDLFRRVCDAVAHGHEQGVIHRDLKPGNILVDAEGQSKVIDFGVAKATDSDLALTTMQTDLGQLIGTLQYMGPEQMEGDPNKIDIRCDVYALGVVLYELLTGRLPYDLREKAVLEVIRIVKEDEPTPISVFDRALKGDVAVIAGTCLEKEPTRRYANASALGDDVGRYLAGEPIIATRSQLIDGARRFARKHRLVAAAMAGVVSVIIAAITLGSIAALIVAIIGFGIFTIRAEDARRRAEAVRQDAENARAIASKHVAIATAALARADQARTQHAHPEYTANLVRLQQLAEQQGQPEFTHKLFQDTAKLFVDENLPIELRCVHSQIDRALTILQGHTKEIRAISYSLDGVWIATGSADATVRIWNADSGQPAKVLGNHRGEVDAIAFSNDSQLIATASSDNCIRVWEFLTERLLYVSEVSDHGIEDIRFTPDNNYAVTLSQNGACNFFDLRIAQVRDRITQDHDQTVRFNPAGEDSVWSNRPSGSDRHEPALSEDAYQLLANDPDTASRSSSRNGARRVLSPNGFLVATSYGTHVKITDARSGEQLSRIKFCDANAEKFQGRLETTAMAFSEEGDFIAIAIANNIVQVCNARSGKQISLLRGHHSEVHSVAITSDGRQIVAGALDGSVRLWTTRDGDNCVAVFHGHTKAVTAVTFSQDESKIATGSADATARVWIIGNQHVLRVPLRIEGIKPNKGCPGFTQVAYSLQGTRCTTITNGVACLWCIPSRSPISVRRVNRYSLARVALSADGTWLATSNAGKLKVRNTLTGRQYVWNARHPAAVLAISADCGIVVTDESPEENLRGQTPPVLAIRSGKTGEYLAALPCETVGGRWETVAFSSDGMRMAACCSGLSKRITVWDTRSWERLLMCEVPLIATHALAFSPNGDLLAAAGTNSSCLTQDNSKTESHVWLWDTQTGARTRVLNACTARINVVAFSPDGMRLAGGASDCTVRIWNVTSGDVVAALVGHKGSVEALAFNSVGTELASVSSDDTLRIWGVSNTALHAAKSDLFAMESALGDKVQKWLSTDFYNALTTVETEKQNKRLTLKQAEVATNMIIERASNSSTVLELWGTAQEATEGTCVSSYAFEATQRAAQLQDSSPGPWPTVAPHTLELAEKAFELGQSRDGQIDTFDYTKWQASDRDTRTPAETDRSALELEERSFEQEQSNEEESFSELEESEASDWSDFAAITTPAPRDEFDLLDHSDKLGAIEELEKDIVGSAEFLSDLFLLQERLKRRERWLRAWRQGGIAVLIFLAISGVCLVSAGVFRVGVGSLDTFLSLVYIQTLLTSAFINSLPLFAKRLRGAKRFSFYVSLVLGYTMLNFLVTDPQLRFVDWLSSGTLAISPRRFCLSLLACGQALLLMWLLHVDVATTGEADPGPSEPIRDRVLPRVEGDTIVFFCPNGHKLMIDKEFAGRRSRCCRVGCEAKVVVPEPKRDSRTPKAH